MLKTAYSVDYQVKGAENEIGVFEGVASTPETDLAGDIVKSGAFGDVNARSIPMLWGHDMKTVIGGWTLIDTKGAALRVTGELNLGVSKAAEVYALMSKGHVSGLSVGFIPDPGFVTYDGRKGIRTISKARLLEISVVPVPANDRARIKRVKSLEGALVAIEEFKSTLIEDYGFSPEEADVIVTKGYQSLVSNQVPKDPANFAPVIEEMKGLLQTLKGSKT